MIRNITLTNIRVDRIEEGELLHFRVAANPRYNHAPWRGIADVIVRNITYTGAGMPSASVIADYESGAGITGRDDRRPVDPRGSRPHPRGGELRNRPVRYWATVWLILRSRA